MAIYNKIYDVLKTSMPTQGELAKIIYGKDDRDNFGLRMRIRGHLAIVRRKFGVQIVADELGRYKMCRPQYTWEDSQSSFKGKIGRPRHYAA